MLGEPQLVQHTVTVTFARHTGIRRSANLIEDSLAKGCPGGYLPPQIMPLPDGFGPEVPRMIFSSTNGFSQLLLSESSIALTVNYSVDWQIVPQKCVEYIRLRSAVLFDILKAIGAEPHYSGVSTKVHRLAPGASNEAVSALGRLLNLGDLPNKMNEINLRWSIADEPNFFRNMVIQSVRSWGDADVSEMDRLRDSGIKAIGVELVSDANDRRGYNEIDGFRTSSDSCLKLISLGFEDSLMWAGHIGG